MNRNQILLIGLIDANKIISNKRSDFYILKIIMPDTIH